MNASTCRQPHWTKQSRVDFILLFLTILSHFMWFTSLCSTVYCIRWLYFSIVESLVQDTATSALIDRDDDDDVNIDQTKTFLQSSSEIEWLIISSISRVTLQYFCKQSAASFNSVSPAFQHSRAALLDKPVSTPIIEPKIRMVNVNSISRSVYVLTNILMGVREKKGFIKCFYYNIDY